MTTIISTTKFPSAATSIVDATPDGASWTNPTNIFADDGLSASNFHGQGSRPFILEATGFGFDIDFNTIIKGIEVIVKRSHTFISSSAWLPFDKTARLTRGGIIQGDEKKFPCPPFWPLPAAPITYGSPTDLWGLALDSNFINNPTFGFTIRFGGDGNHGTIGNIDFISITVYYVEAPIEPAKVLVNGSGDVNVIYDINTFGGALVDGISPAGKLFTEVAEGGIIVGGESPNLRLVIPLIGGTVVVGGQADVQYTSNVSGSTQGVVVNGRGNLLGCEEDTLDCLVSDSRLRCARLKFFGRGGRWDCRLFTPLTPTSSRNGAFLPSITVCRQRLFRKESRKV